MVKEKPGSFILLFERQICKTYEISMLFSPWNKKVLTFWKINVMLLSRVNQKLNIGFVKIRKTEADSDILGKCPFYFTFIEKLTIVCLNWLMSSKFIAINSRWWIFIKIQVHFYLKLYINDYDCVCVFTNANTGINYI